jgi:nicotinamidase-related amidase
MTALAQAYRAAKLPVIHLVRLYKPDGSNADICRRESIRGGLKMVEPGSEGAQIVPALLPDAGIILNETLLLSGKAQQIGPKEYIVYKPRWGAFFNTCIEDLLRSLGVSTIVICGCNFPNCPRTTIYEASERDYRIAFVSNATSGVYEQGITELRNIGVAVLTANEVVRAVADGKKKK